VQLAHWQVPEAQLQVLVVGPQEEQSAVQEQAIVV